MRTSKLDKIIDYLQGTCNTLDGAVEIIIDGNLDSSDLSMEELEYLDDRIFLCECCGWWYEVSEMSEQDQYCDDCFETDEE